jgi:hypothetical protein
VISSHLFLRSLALPGFSIIEPSASHIVFVLILLICDSSICSTYDSSISSDLWFFWFVYYSFFFLRIIDYRIDPGVFIVNLLFNNEFSLWLWLWDFI